MLLTAVKPLLLTWSLAVEEQYCVLFPHFPVAGLALRAQPRVLVDLRDRRDQPRRKRMELAPTRVWELLAGSICAFWLFGRE